MSKKEVKKELIKEKKREQMCWHRTDVDTKRQV